MELALMEKTARSLMDEHGLVHWSFAWDRAKGRYGCCHHATQTITLSKPLALVNLDNDSHTLDTILHEIAHGLVGPSQGHGAKWKAKAAEIGARPERCGNGKLLIPRWIGKCSGCGAQWKRHRRTLNSMCSRCKIHVEWKVNPHASA